MDTDGSGSSLPSVHSGSFFFDLLYLFCLTQPGLDLAFSKHLFEQRIILILVPENSIFFPQMSVFLFQKLIILVQLTVLLRKFDKLIHGPGVPDKQFFDDLFQLSPKFFPKNRFGEKYSVFGEFWGDFWETPDC
ncbi:MAG: hypothetical protein IJL47_07540 [Lachnospiraceae bacterium]|nr:hypothetical protein [Clostridia bacterium]MBQ5953871.1 hypothetical protein [Lachnospiraceae bacterium]